MQNMDQTTNKITSLKDKYSHLDKQALSIDLKDRKVNNVCQSLPKLYEVASKAKNEKNHDFAYIMLRRWIFCVTSLQKAKVAKELKNYFSNDKIKDVENLLKEVTNSIKLEYETKPKTPQVQDNSAHIDIELRLPEIPNDEPQPKENDEITCIDLAELLDQGIRSSDKRLLIIDVRKEEDYLESRIAFPENIVHIPEEKIQPNKSPDFYRHLLLEDKEAWDRYNRRSAKDVDIIVLLDSNSSLNTVKITSPINIFKKSLKECDPRTKYKRIAILKGGFEEWIKKYPTFVTDPVRKNSVLTPTTPDASSISSSNASYSFLNFYQHEETMSPILAGKHAAGSAVKDSTNLNSIVPSKSDKNLSNPYKNLLNSQQKQMVSLSNANGNYKSPTSVPSQKKNQRAPPSSNGISDKELLLSNNIKEVKVLVEKFIPQVDRSKKPSTLGVKPTVSIVSQLEKELIGTRHSILQYENQLQKGITDDWAREQLETLRKNEQDIMDKLGRPKNTRSADVNSTNIYPDLSDLSNITLGTRKRTTRTLAPNSNEKENVSKLPEKDKIEPMIVDPQPSSTSLRMEVDEEESIYKEPLKSENKSHNPGLKRSHSSPNLVQNIPKSTPTINRSLKPNQATQNDNRIHINQVSWKSREQRFEPVFSSTNLHPGITGLKNLGNSCYMNSIIQCLSNTVYLANYFNANDYADHLNRHNIDKVAKGYVAEEVAQVIRALWRGQYKSISPRDLKNVIGQYKMQFENFDQQDSHEFLMFLLDWMHNDLKQKTKVTYDRALTAAESEWEKSMNGQSSVISKLFFGQLRSTIECLYCEQNSTTYETFNSLTMSLPATNKCTLDECVRKFVSGQRVSGWKCPNCKVPRDGMKKFDIAKLPHIIVIHLNRFGETSGWLEKKNTAVDFPLVNFNMRQYVAQDDNYNNSLNYNYNLYAMSNHYGTMDGGHYTAYCKSNLQNKWYKYDDHTVSEVQANTVKNQSTSAYLLFYASASAENYLNS